MLGTGGMAVVFRAHDEKEDRTVAIKMLRDDIAGDPEAVARFVNESRAVSMLSHPNIVAIHDVSVETGHKYLVMEYIDGVSLRAYMDKRGALPAKEIISYTEQILSALVHAHSKGVVHRDIKPQNIMLLKDGTVKVMDFGIAKLPDSDTAAISDKTVGTVYYISPEQAQDSASDARSDLYSLGVMMYEMSTGKLPFDDESPISVVLMHMHDKPTPPHRVDPSIPRGLEQIILYSMEKNPAKRYQCAADMLREKFPERKLCIVDSLGASSGSGLLTVTLADLRDQGKSIDEVYAWALENRLHVHHWFYSSDLTFYVKGGRVTKAAGWFGTVLKICPVLNMDNLGRLIPRFKVRGKQKALQELLHQMEQHADGGADYCGRCFICQSDCEDDARKLAAAVEERFPHIDGRVQVFPIGPTIGSHTGPGTAALFFFGDERVD